MTLSLTLKVCVGVREFHSPYFKESVTMPSNFKNDIRNSFEFNEFFAQYEECYTAKDIEEYVDALGLDTPTAENLKLALMSAQPLPTL